MNLKQKLKQYFELQDEIYKYFGYVEDWVVIPIDYKLDSYWFLEGDDETGKVVWSPDQFTADTLTEGKKIYSGIIYTQRFLPKWVYRTEDYTMISVDTQCDGNKFLMVFDNKLECKDKELIESNPW